MFDKLFSSKPKVVNKRQHVRSRVAIKVCLATLSKYDPETGAKNVSRCMVVETVDMSMGGACLKHPGILITNDWVMLMGNMATSLKDCTTCSKKTQLTEVDLMYPIIGKVRWRTNNRAGVEFVEINDADRETIHKLVWEHHLKEVKTISEISKGFE